MTAQGSVTCNLKLTSTTFEIHTFTGSSWVYAQEWGFCSQLGCFTFFSSEFTFIGLI